MARPSGFTVAFILCGLLALGGFVLLGVAGATSGDCGDGGFASPCKLSALPYMLWAWFLLGASLVTSIIVGIAWSLSADGSLPPTSPDTAPPAPLK